MCDELAAFREAIARYASGVDARLLSPNDAAHMLDDAAAVEAMAATLKALAAARVAECDDWRKSGHRSPAEAVARNGDFSGRGQRGVGGRPSPRTPT